MKTKLCALSAVLFLNSAMLHAGEPPAPDHVRWLGSYLSDIEGRITIEGQPPAVYEFFSFGDHLAPEVTQARPLGLLLAELTKKLNKHFLGIPANSRDEKLRKAHAILVSVAAVWHEAFSMARFFANAHTFDAHYRLSQGLYHVRTPQADGVQETADHSAWHWSKVTAHNAAIAAIAIGSRAYESATFAANWLIPQSAFRHLRPYVSFGWDIYQKSTLMWLWANMISYQESLFSSKPKLGGPLPAAYHAADKQLQKQPLSTAKLVDTWNKQFAERLGRIAIDAQGLQWTKPTSYSDTTFFLAPFLEILPLLKQVVDIEQGRKPDCDSAKAKRWSFF